MERTIGEIKLSSSSFEWKIKNFASLSAETGECYESPPFDFYNATWCLVIYPNGSKDIYSSHISVFLTKLNYPEVSHTVFQKISIKKSDGTDYICRECKSEHYKSKTTWGHREFLERSKALEGIAPDGDLRISCTVNWDHCNVRSVSETVATKIGYRQSLCCLEEKSQKTHRFGYRQSLYCLGEKSQKTHRYDAKPPEPNILWKNLVCNMKDAFLKKKNCDVIIKVKEEDFPAHRMMLESRSTVFEAMFENNTSESRNGVVEISDTKPDVFRDFLLYLYCGEVDEMSCDNVYGLYALADKFDMEDLKQECVKFMECNLTLETVCDVLLLAEKYSEKQLNETAKSFVLKNPNEVLSSCHWKKLEVRSHLLSNQILKSILLDKASKPN